MEKAYEGTPFADDAGASAGLYLEIGHAKPELYGAALKLLPEGAATPTVHEKKRVAVFRCLEFYESPRLRELAKKAK